MKKAFLQISFSWLFAIIVGAFILFLAIYGSTKMISNNKYQLDVETAKNIEVLLSPLETGYESATVTSMNLPRETRIYNECENYTKFGSQTISVSQKSWKKWSENSDGSSISNKYIFSTNPVEGKKFYLFAKPFEMPFKVGDVIYLTSASDFYCFKDADEEIEDEISNLKENNPTLNMGVFPNCSEDSINVCFGNALCEINVDYEGKYVKKNSKKMVFESDALMYAAIFSDVENYECQVQRLMQRTAQLAKLYKEKENIISKQGCELKLSSDLGRLINLIETSSSLRNIWDFAEDIQLKNERAQQCRLW